MEEKSKIDLLAEELARDAVPETESALAAWEAEHPDNRKLRRALHRIRIPQQVNAYAGRLREPVLAEINRRIDRAVTRRRWLRTVGAAASVLLLLSFTGFLAYRSGYRHVNSQLVRIENPLGTRTSVRLPDGSRAMLNAGTVLSYPSAFTGKERNVTVTGEAFFEVQPDKRQPFVVGAGDIRVQVFGTKFNVKAYDEEEAIEVTLEEGSVGAALPGTRSFVKIKPGEQLTFDRLHGTFSRHRVNPAYYTAWREGKFYFDAVPLEEIARRLERHFNVHIAIASEKLKCTAFTGDFVRQENIEQILRVMTADRRIRYRIDGDRIFIDEK